MKNKFGLTQSLINEISETWVATTEIDETGIRYRGQVTERVWIYGDGEYEVDSWPTTA